MQLFCNVLLVGISTALVLDRNLKSVFIDGFLPFPNGSVPYVITDELNIERIVQPMLDIAKWSTGCITFRPKIDSDKRYLWIRPATEDRCDTVPGSEIVLIVIGPHCMFGNILHQLMHGLGFGHEHSRPDRDQYIHVNLENVQADLRDQFNISAKYRTLTPYDYQSIMHYGGFADKIPSAKGETIYAIGDIDEEPDDFYLMGQRGELSNWDKIALTDYCSLSRRMYLEFGN